MGEWMMDRLISGGSHEWMNELLEEGMYELMDRWIDEIVLDKYKEG